MTLILENTLKKVLHFFSNLSKVKKKMHKVMCGGVRTLPAWCITHITA